MIPKNITRQNILNAISEIDKVGVPANRHSTKFQLFHETKLYPPKYILSIANKFSNGEELSPVDFSGGNETNSFLINLGFEIIEGHDIIPKKNNNLITNTIVTAIIESDEHYNNKSRLLLLEEILKIAEPNVDIIVLPGGFIKFSKLDNSDIKEIEIQVTELFKKTQKNLVVCFGIDAPVEINQLGIAISPNGILALGRKFCPTDEEKPTLVIANSPHETEFGFNRVFSWKGKNHFLAICYDSFGIKHLNQPLKDIDFVIDLIHWFYPKGEVPSGEVYFAKHGLAGSSKQLKCPVFGSATFFNRSIPADWPSGVIWKKGNMSTQFWKYKDNPLHPLKTQVINTKSKHENAFMRYFILGAK